MDLETFVKEIRKKPVPISVVSDGKIIDGAVDSEWTVEKITAEAFNQDILVTDSDTWDSGLSKVREILHSLAI